MNSKRYSSNIVNDILKYKNMKARNSSNLLEQQKIDEKALRYKRKKSPLEIPNIAKKKTFTYKQNSNQNDGNEKEKFSPFRPSVYEPMKQTKIPKAQFETQKSKPIRKKQKNADDTEESASFVQSDILDSKKTETETFSQAQNETNLENRSKGPAKKHPLVHQKMKLPGNYDKGLENLNKLQQDMIKAQNEAKTRHAQKGTDKLKETAYMKDEIEPKHETPMRERRMTIEGLHNYAKNEISKVNAAFKRVGIPRKNLLRRPGSADNEAKSNLLKTKKHSHDYLTDADVNKKIMRSPPSPKRLGDDNLLDDKLFNERLENYGKKSPKSMFPPPKVSPKSFPKESPKQKRHRGDRGKEKSSEKGSSKTSSASDSKSKKQKEADRYHDRDDKDQSSSQQHHPQFSGESKDSYEDATYNMRKHKGRHIPDFFRLFHASVIENKQDSFDGRDYGNIDFRLLKLGFTDSDDDYYIDEFGNRVLKGKGRGDPNQGGRDGTDGEGNADGENYDYYLNVLRDGGTLDDDDPNLNPSAKLLLTEFESPYPDLGTGNTLSSSGLSHDKGRGLGFDDMDGAFGGKKKKGLFDDSDDDGKGGKGRGKWGKGNRLGGLGFSDTYSSDSLNANKKRQKGGNDMDDDDDLNSESNLYGGKKYQRKAYETGILDIKGKKAFAWENYINNLLQVGKLERKSSREQWFRFELPMDMKLLETMSTEEYLRDFCFLSRDREIVYERPYTKFQTNPKDGKPYLSREKLFEAVQDVMIESLTEEQIEELQSMIEMGDNISRVYFNGICAVAQRLYFRQNLGSFTFEAILCQRSFLEKADFHALGSKLKGVKVKTPLDKLINAINLASIEQEDESEMRNLHKVDRRFVVKRPSFHDMFSAMLSN